MKMILAEPNPPWMNRILHANWQALETLVGPPSMPAEAGPATVRRRVVLEYGCGHYGCVAPTGMPGLVFKLTSDPLEAHFITAAMSLGDWPEGIVRYHLIVQIPGAHHGRPVFAVWREEAFQVGLLSHLYHDDHPEILKLQLDRGDRNALLRFRRHLELFKHWAGLFKQALDRTQRPLAAVLGEMKRYQPMARQNLELDHLEDAGWAHERGFALGQKLAFYHRACELIAEVMANESGGYLVGRTLEFYLEQGLLLADVHAGNIGRVVREDYKDPIWAITDPGHAVPLDARFASVVVPAL